MVEGILASIKALFVEEHKKKLAEDARLSALARKVYKEILEDVVLESLKTLSIEEVQRKVANEATMMEIDGESLFEDVIVKLIQAQSEQEQKLRSLREFNLQWTHGVALFFLDIAERKVEIEVTMVSEDLDLAYKDAIEEAMVRSIIEASFHGLKDDIIETDPSSKLIRPRPVSEADEQALNVVLFDEMDEDNIKCLIFFSIGHLHGRFIHPLPQYGETKLQNPLRCTSLLPWIFNNYQV